MRAVNGVGAVVPRDAAPSSSAGLARACAPREGPGSATLGDEVIAATIAARRPAVDPRFDLSVSFGLGRVS